MVEATRPAARAIQSWGWELHRLCRAAEVLRARWKKGSLPPDVSAFLTANQPDFSTATVDERIRAGFNQRLLVRGDRVLVSWESLAENGVPPGLPGLFHLPALRGFWNRALRQSHHGRLKRELPRAWFVTGDPLPPGAVLPGPGLAASNPRPDDSRFVRTATASGEIVIEATLPPDATGVVARYEKKDGRITLISAARV